MRKRRPARGRRSQVSAISLPAAMSSAATPVEMPTAMMTPATMEVPATAKGETDRRAVPVIVGIGLVVVGRCVVAVTSERSSAVPMSTVPPTWATAAIVYLLDVGRVRHFQSSKATNRPRRSWSR